MVLLRRRAQLSCQPEMDLRTTISCFAFLAFFMLGGNSTPLEPDLKGLTLEDVLAIKEEIGDQGRGRSVAVVPTICALKSN